MTSPIEAEARRIYEAWLAASWAGENPPDPWERAPAMIRNACLQLAAGRDDVLQPYQGGEGAR